MPFDLLTLARPRLLPFVLTLPLVGFGWAHWDRALELVGERRLPPLLAAWTLLHAGTLWLNAALDRDDGPVLLGRAVAVPPSARSVGYVALMAAVAVAWWAGVVAGLACAVCAALAVAYSHPRTAWKGHAILGPVVNFVGYGLLSPLAGWSLVGVPPDARTLLVWPLGALGVMGCYFAAQAFQGPEDRARGYRTLVATHGPRGALMAARLCLGAGFAGGTALALAGWLPDACLAAAPLGAWIDDYLADWSRQPAGGDETWARGLAVRLLGAAALAVGLAYLDFLAGPPEGPVAGLATRAGRPWP